ncbi:peptidoglycan DD-metalloendopeptidase family protein [Kordia sp.]|uniref:peptidoglycan DD-metalloendopeptidase family protein n=1 Tax=Kordia sp. TaxID=1965332 RepID=UPI0025BDA5AD|nr:peptidoglycan DD-metalloendopeptidase family protein [Kordia sp.]MCH2194545.1 peptidoglycan DD-metalloendopeptidase family protein [Kordia sp.]
MKIAKITLLTLLLVALYACSGEKKNEKEIVQVEAAAPDPMEFGFHLNDYVVVRDTVRSGDSFGEILGKNHIGYSKIFQIAEKTKDTFDITKLKAGKPYTLLCTKGDSLQRPECFIYQENSIDYVVINFKDSINAYKESKPVKIVEKEASGVILSSLSASLDDAGLSQLLAYNMSDIYAWTIDFFRLQKGDEFKLIYTEKYINDTTYVGIDKIHAAYFKHNGEPFYAFEFETDSVKQIVDFYDENAKNLRRAFLKAPVRYKHVRISSRYNLRRRIKLYGNRIRPHKGTDFAAPIGTPIISTANGVVVESARRGGNGNYVKVKHNSTYTTQYLHMSKRKAKVGEFVKQGDVIGWVGMTGNTSGPHVCYRFWKNGRQVDPFKQKLPDADPIDLKLKESYLEFIKPLKQQLDGIQIELPIEEAPITAIN